MLNALEIYNRINNYKDIQDFIGTQENIFLDFKTSSSLNGTPTNDDKNNLKEAISGFSHQEGGVIVWGIDCRINKTTSVDEAIKEKPIINVGDFQKKLEDFFPYTTEPLVDGVLHKIIFLKNDSSTKNGFLIFYIPKSYKVHRILSPKKNILFYRRYGSQFHPVESTEEIRSLFFRKNSPELEIDIYPYCKKPNLGINCSLKNIGIIPAKSISVFISILPISHFTYYDGGGNDRWDSWTPIINGDGTRTFMLKNGFVLHQGQTLKVFQANGYFPAHLTRQEPETIEYIVYAENMEPIKGSISLKEKET